MLGSGAEVDRRISRSRREKGLGRRACVQKVKLEKFRPPVDTPSWANLIPLAGRMSRLFFPSFPLSYQHSPTVRSFPARIVVPRESALCDSFRPPPYASIPPPAPQLRFPPFSGGSQDLAHLAAAAHAPFFAPSFSPAYRAHRDRLSPPDRQPGLRPRHPRMGCDGEGIANHAAG